MALTKAKLQQRTKEFRDRFARVSKEIGKRIVGYDDLIDKVLICLFARGHVLLEGVPGLGKTLLVRTLADALSLQFSRIQFTPDLMPADVTGTTIMAESEDGEREFQFRQGPIFAHVILADEINRATPKTQSALLEAMQELSVTVGGRTHHLELPFIVLGTQNPHGWAPLHALSLSFPPSSAGRVLKKQRFPWARPWFIPWRKPAFHSSSREWREKPSFTWS